MADVKKILNNWETRLMEMNRPISEMELQIEGSVLEKSIRRLYWELDRQKISFKPKCYLTDTWGCPNTVPVIGIPFYYADPFLSRIEAELNGDLEDEQEIRMTLRHEAGHAINYAYRLYITRDWQETFGRFSEPYRDTFRPDPRSRDFVRHLYQQVGKFAGHIYAQKHPDEDFAETFAVWLTPRSKWRQKYRHWGALRKLKYIDRVMKEIGPRPPVVNNGKLIQPVESLKLTLLEFYKENEERYRQRAQGYVDDVLRQVFSSNGRGKGLLPAADFLAGYRPHLVKVISQWSGEGVSCVEPLVEKLILRARELDLHLSRSSRTGKLIEITSLATCLVMNYSYEGKFITG